MAEQRPYRLPGLGAHAQLARVKKIAGLSVGGTFLALNCLATQHASALLGGANWLGTPVFRLPYLGRVYAPWSWMVWWYRSHGLDELEPLWLLCSREVLYPTGAIAALAMGAIGLARKGWIAAPSDLHGSARWATTRDLKAARLIGSRATAGVYLGIWRQWHRNSHVRDCGPAHVLVFAPTRSGKGVGIVVPTLLTWPESVLVHDLKGENWALTSGARKRMGQTCLRFAPASPEDDGARYNPLAEVRLRTPHEVRDVRNIVQMIVDPDGKGLPDHWSREGTAFLTGMILDQLYRGHDRTLHGLEARLCDPDRPIDETIEETMRAQHAPEGSPGWTDSRGLPTRTHPVVARAMRSMLDKSPNERSGVISEVKGFLELYRDPVIAANTAASDFSISDLMNHERPVSLYIVVPLAHKNSLRPLIRLMLSQILHRLTERLEFRDGRAVGAYRHRLLLMIDEFPSLGKLEMFADSLSLIAGYGIKGCLITQDLSQIHAAYGHDEAITSNCHTRVAFTSNRIETARLLSEMAGETTVRHAHRTVSSSGASFSEPEIARALITSDEAMRLGTNEALIFTSGRPAIRATKIRYYRDTFFKKLASIPAAPRSDRIEPATPKVPNPRTLCTAAVPEEQEYVDPNPSPNGETRVQHGEQLSFLKFAIEGSKPEANGKKGKERLV